MQAPFRRARLSLPGVFVVLSLVGLVVLYAPSFDIGYYSDDYAFALEQLPVSPLYFFTHPQPHNGFYRPIQAGAVILIQKAMGLDPMPIRILNMLLHWGLCLVIYRAMRTAGCSLVQCITGAGYALVSQAAAAGVIGNDTTAQVASTFFGFCALLPIARRLAGRRTPLTPAWAGIGWTLLFLALALFTKESAAGTVLILMMLCALHAYRTPGKRVRTFCAWAVPILVLVAGYYMLRMSVAVPPAYNPEGTYSFNVGMNIPKNMGLLAVASVIPLSTISVALAKHHHDLQAFIQIGMATLAFAGIVCFGLWKQKHQAPVWATAALLGVVAMFPMAAMNHVGELYAYSVLPFISIVAGIAGGGLIRSAAAHRAVRLLVPIVGAALIAGHIAAIRGKIDLALGNAERCAVLVQGITPYLERVPRHGELILVNSTASLADPGYSVFLHRGFMPVDYMACRFWVLAGRDDFNVAMIEEQSVDSLGDLSSKLLLTSDDGRHVREYTRSTAQR